MYDGRIVKEGGSELVEQLEREGYGWVRDEARGGRMAMGALADTAIAHEFPSLDREGLVYLDSGATSQTPRTVLDAMEDYYAHHRGERAPRRLPAGRRGDRALRGRARAHRARG